MSFNRHIVRNFDANRTNRIRYDKDDFICEIFRFDKTYEQHYALDTQLETYYAKRSQFNGFPCIRREKDGKNYAIVFTYDAKETSDNYRLECLYANSRKGKNGKLNKTLVADAKIYINGELQKQTMKWVGNDVNFNRHYQYATLKEGKNIIRYVFSSNTIFIGFVVKKFDVWSARRHNDVNDRLTMIRATVDHSEELQVNTMSAEFMYYHELDETLPPTDSRANRSGLIFDYRDEINLYVKDTNGTFQRVFGGYISTVEVDDDLTKITMECADRLIDLDRRYCLSEVQMKDFVSQDDIDYNGSYDYLRHFNNYSDSLKFLMNNAEVIPKTNIRIGHPIIKRRNHRLATYREKGYRKITHSNMPVYVHKGSVTLRNGDDTLKPQYAVIYDAKTGNDMPLLNKYPNLYLHYGLGEEKWEEKVEETTTVNVENGSMVSQSWIDRANSITSATGSDAIEPIWRYIGDKSKVSQDSRANFFQSVEKTWTTKNGNCCLKTELLLTLLSAKGLTDLKYVHCYASPKRGHVFAKVNGFYVDPSTANPSRGWHNYIRGYGAITHITDFPKKPF